MGFEVLALESKVFEVAGFVNQLLEGERVEVEVKSEVFREPSRKFLIWVGVASVMLSVFAALTCYQFRQTPYRTGHEAWIPFRTITVQEATKLYQSSYNGIRYLDIISYGDESVLVSTSRFVLPEGVTSGEAPNGMSAVSWNGYKTIHEIPRKPFEKSIGLDMSRVPQTQIDMTKVSFDSRRLGFYIAFEVVFVAVSLFLLIFCFYVIRSKWWWLPAYMIWTTLYTISVIKYSPALFDADMFYQRLMVDIPIPFMVLSSGWLFPIGGLMVAGGIISWLVKMLQKNGSIGSTGRLYSKRMAQVSPFIVVVSIIVAMNYYRESGIQNCLNEIRSTLEKEQIQSLAGFSEDIDLPNGDLKKCSLNSCKRLESRLQSLRVAIRPSAISTKCGSGSTEITLFMPITADRWIFAMLGPDRTYGDIRNPHNSIGFSAVALALEEAEAQPLFDFGLMVSESISFGGIKRRSIAAPLETNEGKKFAAIVGNRSIDSIFQFYLKH